MFSLGLIKNTHLGLPRKRFLFIDGALCRIAVVTLQILKFGEKKTDSSAEQEARFPRGAGPARPALTFHVISRIE